MKELWKSADFQEDLSEARGVTDTSPTPAQMEAGNYRKGKVKVRGWTIAIENPKGSKRSGVDKDGKRWTTTMANDYGYILRTKAVDGDHLDVFLGPDPEHGRIFVVDQEIGGKYDESKTMLGFPSAADAKAAYLANYSKGWNGFAGIREMTADGINEWVDGGQEVPAKEASAVPNFTAYLDSPKYFGRPGSKVRAAMLLEAARKHQIDPRLLASIVANESAWGTHRNATSSNNFTGMMGAGRKLFKYRSPQAGLDAAAGLL